MKHFYYFLTFLFLTVLTTQAQNQDFTSQVDYYFQHLDKSKIPTGILYERVFPAADVGRFANTSIDTTSALHFLTAFDELQTADYTGRWQPAFTIIDNLSAKPPYEVPVGVIHIDYNTIDELAMEDGLLDITTSQGDTLLVDVPNRPRAPYLPHTTTFASPLKMQTNSLSPGFYWEVTRQDSQTSISTLEVNFNLGNGWQTLSSVITPTFPGYGVYYIDFKITLSNSVTRINRARFEIVPETNATTINQKIQDFSTGDCLASQGEFYASRSFQGYDETQAYYGKGEYKIDQGGSAIDKLIVVVDGFDPGEGTNEGNDLEGIYADFNQEFLANNLRTINDFDIVSLNLKKQVLFNSGNSLFPTVINGGSDYIERNAMVLVTLIEKLNSCKTGNQPIKVVGFSMGGVVARYALRYMEEQNINHNVDLFVSVDSPHQGAVIPKGIQDVAELINDVTLGFVKGPLNLLESPAAKQLLKHHISSNSVSPTGAPYFHNQIFTELNQMGYPQNSRNISIINGTLDGSPINGFGQQYVNANARAILGILKADMKLNYSPIPGNTINDLYSRFYLRFPLLKITIFKRERSVSSISSLGSLENSPGGYYDVDKLTDKFFEGGFNNVFGNTSGSTLQHFIRDVFLNVNVTLTDPNFSFIPSKSGLDFIGDPYLYENLNVRDLTCSGETPFDTYFAPEVNQKHISIGSQAADFIKDEINGIQREPSVEPILWNLSGPDLICDKTTYTFDACAGSISDWSVSSNLIIEDSTPYSVIVRPKSSTSVGDGFVKATGSHGTSTKRVQVGKPTIYTLNSDGSKNYMGASYSYQTSSSVKGSFSVFSDSPNTNFTWNVSPSINWWQINNNTVEFDLHITGNYTFTAIANNEGCTHNYFITVNISEGTGFETYAVYPNPASEEVYIEDVSKRENNTSAQRATYPQQSRQGKLYDFSGNLVKTVPLQAQSAITRMEVSHLKPGLYFLKIQVRDEEEVYKIIVAH